MNTSQRNFWPYEEVNASKGPLSPTKFQLCSPWLKFNIQIEEKDIARSDSLLKKLASGAVGAQDLEDVNWFFSALSHFPLCYILPRAHNFGTDHHDRISALSDEDSPQSFLSGLFQESDSTVEYGPFTRSYLPKLWSWDKEAALEFSKTAFGFDPESLFSVARRFHLLNDLEWNKSGELIALLKGLSQDPEKFRSASALVVRQNHYVTEQCDSVLRTALPIAQNAYEIILEFISAESGHDKILNKALKALGETQNSVPTISSIRVLMEIFRLVAKRNLLAFSMVVDIFERTSYSKVDPFAAVLNEGGQETAGRQIDSHRAINDMGAHENVALEFLRYIGPVDIDYAREALFLAELTTLVAHQVSRETLDLLKRN